MRITKYAVSGGSASQGSTSASRLTATEWVEWRCTTARASERSLYMQKCRKASLVGLPPETKRFSLSNFDRVAGSSRPSEALVGVMSQPPSGKRTLMFPVDPKVKPRENKERPTSQISSRARVSSPMSLPLPGHGQSVGEEIP